jgi:excisionase family DNA binding protein
MTQLQEQLEEQQTPTDLLTVTAAAERFALPRTIVSSWITTGQLPAVRVNGRRHVRAEDVAETQARAHEGEVVPAWRQNRRRAGKRLRAIREAAGLNQIQLAAASGLTHEAISRLETGRCWPYAETVRKLAGALGVEPERFVAREKTGLSLMTVAEAASRLGVPAGRVQNWLRKGQVSGTKVSGEWRVPSVVIAELARSGRLRGRSGRLDPRFKG